MAFAGYERLSASARKHSRRESKTFIRVIGPYEGREEVEREIDNRIIEVIEAPIEFLKIWCVLSEEDLRVIHKGEIPDDSERPRFIARW